MATDAPRADGDGARPVILIAEDEPFIVESLTFLLERQGYAVESVRDGAVALARLSSRPPDLLILETMIPSENGFDVLRQLHQMPHGRTVPVLMLTAKGQDSDRRQMMSLGADEFVTKPFSNQDLLARVGRLIDDGDARK